MRCGCRVAAARSDVSGPHDISPTCYGRFHLPGAHMSNGTPRKFARVFVSARIGLGGPRSLLSPFASALTSRSTPRVVAPRIVTLRHSSTSTPIFSARIVARNDTQTKTPRAAWPHWWPFAHRRCCPVVAPLSETHLASLIICLISSVHVFVFTLLYEGPNSPPVSRMVFMITPMLQNCVSDTVQK